MGRVAVEGAAAAEAAAAVGVDDVLESRVVAARAVAKALAIRLNLCLVVAVEDCWAVKAAAVAVVARAAAQAAAEKAWVERVAMKCLREGNLCSLQARH